MNPEETHIAVGELVQAAAHQHGVVGPVPFTVSRPKYYEWCGLEDDEADGQYPDTLVMPKAHADYYELLKAAHREQHSEEENA